MPNHQLSAEDALRRAAVLAPDAPEPLFRLCALLLQRGAAEAQAMLGDLLARFPLHAPGWEALGVVLEQAGKAEAALVCFGKAAAVVPSFTLAMRQGGLLRQLGRHPEAAACFEQAVALNAGNGLAWFRLGLCRQDAGDLAGAATAYQTALDSEPALAEAAVNLGTVLQDAGRLDDAKQAYGRAVRTRGDTFGRVAQALTTSTKGELWLDLGRLRRDLAG
ncbi:tetratricopeptide repeat protein [Lichenihabitans psoromatis]|uniref:tetratricopeptide repeat protein n=1 Tax=Lichenihabitans psoromatis TaxID=2528642 RepID=UPI0013F15764|nr:tetratricopeptide repeat protein [Lichenihabitans psoromatis]